MRLLLASRLFPEAIELLRERHTVVLGFESSDSLGSLIGECDALVFRSGVLISNELVEAAVKLRLIVRAGSGIDNIDVDTVRARGIRMARVPGASPEAVAELTLGLLLATARNISEADSLVRRGHWPKHRLGGPLVAGKTMGIVGAGRIGMRTGVLCKAIGMRVLGCVETPDPEQMDELAAVGIELADFDTVISESDFVSIHTPLQESTRNLIDAAAIEKMRPGAILINTARGGVVDEAAAHYALSQGHLRAAAFDVHELEGDGVVPALASLPNVVLTPHIGGMAHESQRLIGIRVSEIVDGFVGGRLDEILASEERVV